MRRKTVFALLISLLLSIIYNKHLHQLFENERHFSHLSTVEREMSFRTEMGFYLNYYKRIADQKDITNDNSLMGSINSIINDNLSEFPNTINGLKKFNIYPELIIGLTYRSFNQILNYLGIDPLINCWIVNRGHNLSPVESCEGISDHLYFYLNSIFIFNCIVCGLIFLNSYIISGFSIFGGLLSVLMFGYNHSNCSRVQWTPNLRESFGYPIYLLLHCYINFCIESQSQLNGFITVVIVMAFIICWQFSQFILFSQLISLFLTFKCLQTRLSKNSFLNNLFKFNFYAILFSTVIMFFNTFLFTSLYFSFIVSNLIMNFLLTNLRLNDKMLGMTKIKARIIRIGMKCLSVFSLTVILKVLISSLIGNRDDSHIWYLLLSKLSNYRDFHTLLYTCSPEFDFLPLEDIKSMTLTALMPLSIIVIIISIIKWPNKPVIQFNVIQTVLFMFMALFIMRLKLLFVPQLCIMTGLLCRSSSLNLRNITVFALLISLSSRYGIQNIKNQYNIIGEYFNEPLEELIEFTISSTHPNSVFAGIQT